MSERGIKCGKCSSFQNNVYHATVADVASCYQGQMIPTPPPSQSVEKTENPAKMDWDFPSGHYAVEMDGKLHFFQVDKPEKGKWEGWTFLKEQASDEKYPVKGRRMLAVFQAISEDWHEAMLAYGREIGKCGHCNRTLTDEDSRARGIGPVCARKMSF